MCYEGITIIATDEGIGRTKAIQTLRMFPFRFTGVGSGYCLLDDPWARLSNLRHQQEALG